jgi:hypothetical protein
LLTVFGRVVRLYFFGKRLRSSSERNNRFCRRNRWGALKRSGPSTDANLKKVKVIFLIFGKRNH